MLDITLETKKELVLEKNLFRTVTLTYLGLSEDGENLQFSVYERLFLSRQRQTVNVPTDNLEESTILGIPPYSSKITDFDEKSVDCYIRKMPIRVDSSIDAWV